MVLRGLGRSLLLGWGREWSWDEILIRLLTKILNSATQSFARQASRSYTLS